MLAHGYLPVSRIMALDKGDLTLLALKSTVVPWRAARGKWCCIHCGQECTVMQIHSNDSMQVDTRFKMNRNTKRFINIQLHADQWKQGEQWNCGRLWRGWSPRGVRGEPMEPPRLIVLTQQHLVTILVMVALPTPWISLFKYISMFYAFHHNFPDCHPHHHHQHYPILPSHAAGLPLPQNIFDLVSGQR